MEITIQIPDKHIARIAATLGVPIEGTQDALENYFKDAVYGFIKTEATKEEIAKIDIEAIVPKDEIIIIKPASSPDLSAQPELK